MTVGKAFSYNPRLRNPSTYAKLSAFANTPVATLDLYPNVLQLVGQSSKMWVTPDGYMLWFKYPAFWSKILENGRFMHVNEWSPPQGNGHFFTPVTGPAITVLLLASDGRIVVMDEPREGSREVKFPGGFLTSKETMLMGFRRIVAREVNLEIESFEYFEGMAGGYQVARFPVAFCTAHLPKGFDIPKVGGTGGSLKLVTKKELWNMVTKRKIHDQASWEHAFLALARLGN